MNDKNILIVGAGALGMTCGYVLQMGGASISFLVRPHRVEQLSRPQKLFSYNEHAIKTLDNYNVYSSADTLNKQAFDYVLLTLDGATCRSEQGVQTLKRLGAALASTTARLIIAGVGIGLYDHVKQTTGLAAENILQGTMTTFAYQVGQPLTPLPPAEDRELHDSADIAYYTFPDGNGFIMATKPRQTAKAFAAVFGQAGLVQCRLLPAGIYTMSTNLFFPFTVASELDNWQGTESLISNQALWPLVCESQREIMRLKRHGLMGKIFALLSKPDKVATQMRNTEAAAKPIGFTAFNRFHHGGKVLAQDVQILENCVAAGKADGQAMPATNALLKRWEDNQAS